jgi:hypothetical protein
VDDEGKILRYKLRYTMDHGKWNKLLISSSLFHLTAIIANNIMPKECSAQSHEASKGCN